MAVLLIVGLKWGARLTMIENDALNWGSSKHGNTFRADIGSICVAAIHLKYSIEKFHSLCDHDRQFLSDSSERYSHLLGNIALSV